MAHANGKVILLGEHAVVYGVPAIVVGIDKGATANARVGEHFALRINDRELDDAEPLGGLRALAEYLGTPPLAVTATLDVPPGAGLGASAALGVAIARAALEATGEADTASRVLGAADAWERVFHGNPSGVDTAAAYYGGCLSFKRGLPPRPLAVAQPLGLAIAIAAPPASTKAMVDSVARLRQRRPELVDKTLEGIHALVNNAALCIEAGDSQGLGKLMDYNQMLLSGLFLSTPQLEAACQIARESGAYGAKLTGAGGGGSVVALADQPQRIAHEWQKMGIDAFSCETGASR